ncbi:arrestin domain-containing protein 17-like [Pieris napi]|uniref:arrestin domain-containing protein 17-like n=1 Tax=Pieris napi TaxID=78633 RepID=UPI001FB98B9A|nr:arrestin domain-containing protein 17-like [Pieris napi]
MGFDEGLITLNSDNGSYFPGQTVYGKLVFSQDKIKKFRGISAKLKGYCKIHWTTHHSRRNSQGKSESYTVTHESYEEYINHKAFLIGGERGEVELQPGKYEFPFEFQLPGNCPSSFEGTVGHVRYEIKVVVDRAFKIDQEKKVAVRIISPLDLNQDPYCREPIEFEFEDVYCCCCLSRGATDTVVKLPVAGYCPGQLIPIEVACENSGRVTIDDIKLMIKKKVTYHASTNPATRETKDLIAEIKKGPIPGDTTRNWTVEMVVPSIDIYNLAACRYIDVDYTFKVVVSPSGCHSDSKGYKRLVIGNIPLVGYQDDIQNPLHDQMPQISAPIVNQPSNQGNVSYPAPYPYPEVTPYPSGASYPVTTQYPSTQKAQTPYPPDQIAANMPYPPPYSQGSQNPPYPQSSQNPPYPQSSQNPPYPKSPAYTSGVAAQSSPANPPYPTPQNMPSANPPYPQNTPYQDTQYPYKGTGLKTGTIGFTVPTSVASEGNPPSMPAVTPANPFATASAPPALDKE